MKTTYNFSNFQVILFTNKQIDKQINGNKNTAFISLQVWRKEQVQQ